MKILFSVIVLSFMLMIGSTFAQEKEPVSSFVVKSEDSTVTNVDQVEILETRTTEYTWTAQELDGYIMFQEIDVATKQVQFEKAVKQLELLKKLRDNVLDEAIKAKLKPESAEDS